MKLANFLLRKIYAEYSIREYGYVKLPRNYKGFCKYLTTHFVGGERFQLDSPKAVEHIMNDDDPVLSTSVVVAKKRAPIIETHPKTYPCVDAEHEKNRPNSLADDGKHGHPTVMLDQNNLGFVDEGINVGFGKIEKPRVDIYGTSDQGKRTIITQNVSQLKKHDSSADPDFEPNASENDLSQDLIDGIAVEKDPDSVPSSDDLNQADAPDLELDSDRDSELLDGSVIDSSNLSTLPHESSQSKLNAKYDLHVDEDTYMHFEDKIYMTLAISLMRAKNDLEISEIRQFIDESDIQISFNKCGMTSDHCIGATSKKPYNVYLSLYHDVLGSSKKYLIGSACFNYADGIFQSLYAYRLTFNGPILTTVDQDSLSVDFDFISDNQFEDCAKKFALHDENSSNHEKLINAYEQIESRFVNQ